MQNKEYGQTNEMKEKTDEALPSGIGERIAFLRRRAGLTQAQLAEKLGISAQAVSKWESGLSCPDIMMLLPLANIFHISTDALLGGSLLKESGVEEKADAAKMIEIAARAIADESNEEGRGVRLEKRETESPVAGTHEESCGVRLEKPEADTEKVDVRRETTGQEGNRDSREEFHKPPEKIHSLHLDLATAEAFIRIGSEFSLMTTGFGEGCCNSTVENGVWRISDKGHRDYLFGMGIRNLFRARKVVLTVPVGYQFRDVRLSMGAGTVTGEGVSTEKCVLNVGAGQMTLLDFHSEESDMKCGMGEIKIEGSLSGRCRIDCGMGCVSAQLSKLDEYGYNLNVGMGDVRIGEDGFTGMGGRYKANNGAKNFFVVNCGMGSVVVKFKE